MDAHRVLGAPQPAQGRHRRRTGDVRRACRRREAGRRHVGRGRVARGAHGAGRDGSREGTRVRREYRNDARDAVARRALCPAQPADATRFRPGHRPDHRARRRREHDDLHGAQRRALETGAGDRRPGDAGRGHGGRGRQLRRPVVSALDAPTRRIQDPRRSRSAGAGPDGVGGRTRTRGAVGVPGHRQLLRPSGADARAGTVLYPGRVVPPEDRRDGGHQSRALAAALRRRPGRARPRRARQRPRARGRRGRPRRFRRAGSVLHERPVGTVGDQGSRVVRRGDARQPGRESAVGDGSTGGRRPCRTGAGRTGPAGAGVCGRTPRQQHAGDPRRGLRSLAGDGPQAGPVLLRRADDDRRSRARHRLRQRCEHAAVPRCGPQQGTRDPPRHGGGPGPRGAAVVDRDAGPVRLRRRRRARVVGLDDATAGAVASGAARADRFRPDTRRARRRLHAGPGADRRARFGPGPGAARDTARPDRRAEG